MCVLFCLSTSEISIWKAEFEFLQPKIPGMQRISDVFLLFPSFEQLNGEPEKLWGCGSHFSKYSSVAVPRLKA